MDDRLLDISEAAEILCTTEDFLYKNWRKFPFAIKLSPKQLRFREHGIYEWLKIGNNGQQKEEQK